MKREKKAIITFDYELFLGNDSGDLYTSLINPTNLILNILKEFESTALFFIDTFFLLFLKENHPEDFIIVKSQVIDILRRGSFLGLHLHSQWLDAIPLKEKRWTFKNFERYRFHSLEKDEQVRTFTESVVILNDIILETKEMYEIRQEKVIHFRAGGWSIQPFEVFRELLQSNSIFFDFSVKPGEKNQMLPYHYYDFEHVSYEKESWNFTSDPLEEEKDGIFVEYPVSVVNLRILRFFITKIIQSLNQTDLTCMGDGRGLAASVGLKKEKTKSKRNIFQRAVNQWRYQRKNSYFENQHIYFKRITKEIFRKKNIAVYVGHPKTFSNEALKNLIYISKNFQSYIPTKGQQ